MEGNQICERSYEAEKERYIYKVITTHDPVNADTGYDTVYSLLGLAYDGEAVNESLLVYDISRTRERAQELATLFNENAVCLCTVTDILDDIL